MAFLTVQNIGIAGIAAALPNTIHDNREYPLFSENDYNLFLKTVGIRYRRIVTDGTTAADLCTIAATKLIEKLAWEKEEIELLVFVTQTPDHQIPYTASSIQHRLGLSKSCMAFDVNLGCSGYVYGLSIISSLLSKMENKKALLLVGDCSSSCISMLDKSVAPLFSDAGSATALEYKQGKQLDFNLQTDGAEFDAIITPHGGMRQPFQSDSLMYEEITNGITRHKNHMILDGLKIFNFALREVPGNVTQLLEKTQQKVDDIDLAVFHQANLLMNETVRKKLHLDIEKTAYTLYEYGNTSSASIPVTLAAKSSDFPSKQNVLLNGFGVGLSWGSCIADLTDCIILPIIEVY
jgi:3-oxoacyl-[acyl-carrier-protein] synthase-3